MEAKTVWKRPTLSRIDIKKTLTATGSSIDLAFGTDPTSP